jgi:hypothetical protein
MPGRKRRTIFTSAGMPGTASPKVKARTNSSAKVVDSILPRSRSACS